MILDSFPVVKDAQRLLSATSEHGFEPRDVPGRPRGDEGVVLVIDNEYPLAAGGRRLAPADAATGTRAVGRTTEAGATRAPASELLGRYTAAD